MESVMVLEDANEGDIVEALIQITPSDFSNIWSFLERPKIVADMMDRYSMAEILAAIEGSGNSSYVKALINSQKEPKGEDRT